MGGLANADPLVVFYRPARDYQKSCCGADGEAAGSGLAADVRG
jgi:hypothetical protein